MLGLAETPEEVVRRGVQGGEKAEAGEEAGGPQLSHPDLAVTAKNTRVHRAEIEGEAGGDPQKQRARRNESNHNHDKALRRKKTKRRKNRRKVKRAKAK